MQLSKRDLTDLSRSVGGLLFAAGAVLVLVRESGHDEWGGFARLLVVLVPAVGLYVLVLGGSDGLRGEDGSPGAAARPWQSVLMVVAILLVPLVLLELLMWVGADTQHSLYGAAVFAVTALLAGYAAWRARVSYAMLLAGLALLVTWQDAWEAILGHSSTDTSRWLLVAAAVLLFAGAAGLARAKAIGASELATAGGIAAVAAGVLGVIVGAFVGAFRSITTLGERSGGVISSSGRRISAGARIYSGPLGAPHRSVSRITSVPRGARLSGRLPHVPLARPSHPLPSLVGTHTSGRVRALSGPIRAAVRPSIDPPCAKGFQTLAREPEEHAPVELAIPLLLGHSYKRATQQRRIDRLVVANQGATVLGCSIDTDSGRRVTRLPCGWARRLEIGRAAQSSTAARTSGSTATIPPLPCAAAGASVRLYSRR